MRRWEHAKCCDGCVVLISGEGPTSVTSLPAFAMGAKAA